VFLWVVEHRVGWLDPIFVGLTILGYWGWIWIVLAPPLALRTRTDVLRATVTTAAVIWIADLVALGLKQLVDRPRPETTLPRADPLLHATGPSFPSGHATTAFAGATILALLLRRAVPGLFLLAAGIAFSRVYVGVHYPSDVLAGAVLGSAVGLAGFGLLRAPRRLSAPRPRSARTRPPG